MTIGNTTFHRDCSRKAQHAKAFREDLLRRIKANLPALEEWLSEAEDHWCEEDGVYRLYHQFWKVFDRLQPLTRKARSAASMNR